MANIIKKDKKRQEFYFTIPLLYLLKGTLQPYE